MERNWCTIVLFYVQKHSNIAGECGIKNKKRMTNCKVDGHSYNGKIGTPLEDLKNQIRDKLP